jgi:hypothetical protein
MAVMVPFAPLRVTRVPLYSPSLILSTRRFFACVL